MYPDLYGQAEAMGISHLLFPEEERKKQKQLNDNKNK
jgi:hypothetical protein